MGEGRQDASQEERFADAAVDARQGEPEVLDVLGERETDGDHRPVDDAVDRPVKMASECPEQQKYAEAFGRLLDDRRLDHARREVDGHRRPDAYEGSPQLHAKRGEQSDGDGCGRPPQQRECERRLRFGFPPVDPANREQHDREGHESHERSDGRRHRPDRIHEVRRDGERDDAEHDESDDREHHDRIHSAGRLGLL